MAKYNFYLPEIPESGETAVLPEAEASHACRVLRLEYGKRIILLNGDGIRAQAEIVKVAKSRGGGEVICRVITKEEIKALPPLIDLYVAPPRAKRMDALVQAVTALGVTSINPIEVSRGVAKPDSFSSMERWFQQSVAALKQSGNPFLPVLSPLRDFKAALRDLSEPGFFGDLPNDQATRSLERSDVSAKCSLWIGPEGGFAEEEKESLLGCGLKPLTAGEWTLRVELAAPVLAAVLKGAKRGW